ncbi:RNA methyltransferase tRNA(m5U54)methyltransferase [Arachnomyces sp. PD_36]|nr:RNA methyltransferase tRNA(m5U54)methyltransferase [Arachnomyces sp. PD_36]
MASDNHSAPAGEPEIATITSPPKAGQIVSHDGNEYETVQEGLAYILTPRQQADSKPVERPSKKNPKQKVIEQPQQAVFYNPIQQFNRDLSVLAIKAYSEHAVEVKKKKVGRKKGKKRKRDDGDGKEENGVEAVKAKLEHDATDQQIENGNAEASEKDLTDQKASKVAPQEEDSEKKVSFSILDALSASGLRALRYAKEIPLATRIVANDLSPDAVESQKMNIKHNGVGDRVHPNIGDACVYMYSLAGQHNIPQGGPPPGKFDVVDLDPYGSAAPFIDAAVQSVSDGGMLCVTCTDAGVFASNGYPEKAHALYGGTPVKGPQSHEGGLRLIVHALATSAAKYGLAIEPLLSLSIDFYARVFVRVHRSPGEVKFRAGKTILVYNCDNGCGAWATQPIAHNRQKKNKKGDLFYHHGFAQGPTATQNCEHCGFRTHVGGPMWGGPLHNPHFIQKILDLLPGADKDTYPTIARIEGMLSSALEEDLDFCSNPRDRTTPPPDNSSSDKQLSTPAQSAIIPHMDPSIIDHHPFFLIPSYLARVLHTQTISENALRGALRHLGYRATRSHTKPGSIRTDAPWDVIWEIMREWVRQKSPIKEGVLREGTAGAGIMRRSRERANKLEGEVTTTLSTLKKDILLAVEGGKDVAEITTKIESALYRASVREKQPKSPKGNGENQQAEDKVGSTERSPSPMRRTMASRVPPNKLDIVFDEELGKEVPAANRKKLVRYQMNPRANWGPMARAK